MEFLNQNLVLYVVAYFMGGIPFGYLLAKFFANVDIKQAGSGNIGATNVLRVVKEKDASLAKRLGVITLLLDALKGALILVIAILLGVHTDTLWTIAALSVLGHCFSPYLMFEGGKGVATAFGVLIILAPLPTLIALGVWFVCAKVFKVSSLSSLLALIVLMIASYILMPHTPHAPLWIIAWVVFYKHIPNIKKLLKREEAKVI
ncbi:MAG: glycerol-3-phosphate 1-O-acyltransferase PlsY [Campylobacterales bacterium]|nr:glycerol-3-phosphate 1-O-acyltransferase PlsY [Campylobacterales bacterium]